MIDPFPLVESAVQHASHLESSTSAAWAQAFGTVLAILVAAVLPRMQRRLDDKHARYGAGDALMVAASALDGMADSLEPDTDITAFAPRCLRLLKLIAQSLDQFTAVELQRAGWNALLLARYQIDELAARVTELSQPSERDSDTWRERLRGDFVALSAELKKTGEGDAFGRGKGLRPHGLGASGGRAGRLAGEVID